MSCSSLACNATRQCDRSCTIEFGRHGAGQDSAYDVACGAALKNCEGCLRDCDLADCGPLRPLQRYSLVGGEEWDPNALLPGFEEAEKRFMKRQLATLERERRRLERMPKPEVGPPRTDFEEIVHLLDLKRCPMCGSDWYERGPGKSSISECTAFVVTFKGKQYFTPFSDLAAQAVALCPYCPDGKGSGKGAKSSRSRSDASESTKDSEGKRPKDSEGKRVGGRV